LRRVVLLRGLTLSGEKKNLKSESFARIVAGLSKMKRFQAL
jgi:hypothetical protein